jgi:hypothetical protein
MLAGVCLKQVIAQGHLWSAASFVVILASTTVQMAHVLPCMPTYMSDCMDMNDMTALGLPLALTPAPFLSAPPLLLPR